MSDEKTQVEKFKQAAKEHGADPSVRWDEQLRKVARPHKPTGLTPSKVKKAKPEKPA